MNLVSTDTYIIHFGGELSCNFDFVYLIDMPVITKTLLVLNINIK